MAAAQDYDLPSVLRGLTAVVPGDVQLPDNVRDAAAAKAQFPTLYGAPRLELACNAGGDGCEVGRRLTVGLVFGGGPAPGAVECVAGLHAALKRWNGESRLIGFKRGMRGLIEYQQRRAEASAASDYQPRAQPLDSDDRHHCDIDAEIVAAMLGDSGMGILGTGRVNFDDVTLAAAVDTVRDLGLNGLVCFGGRHAMAGAARLAEHLAHRGLDVAVVCASKRAEGCSSVAPCLPNISYGYDTTVKSYSWLVGNIAADVASARSAYHFVRLMGKESDFAVLETALAVHPNVVLIGEELRRGGATLADVTAAICDVVCDRARSGRNYGVVLLPENVLGNIVEVQAFLEEATDAINDHALDAAYRMEGEYNKMTSVRSAELSPHELLEKLRSPATRALAERLPVWFLEQVVGSRNVFGEIGTEALQVERLFTVLVGEELARRKREGLYVGKWAAQTHFYGYETRSSAPSRFDAELGNALGHTLRALVEACRTGYVVQMHDLHRPTRHWRPVAIPLTSLLGFQDRGRPRVRHAAPGPDSYIYRAVVLLRTEWAAADVYRFPVGTHSDELPGLVQLAALEHRHRRDAFKSEEIKTRELLDCVRRLSLEHSSFMEQRLRYMPRVPAMLKGGFAMVREGGPSAARLAGMFPHLDRRFREGGGAYRVVPHGSADGGGAAAVTAGHLLRVGIVLSGGPAPGGHNVISGLYDFLRHRNVTSKLLGFVNGPDGLLNGRYIEVTEEGIAAYRNQGGFNYLGTSRTKIETPQQLARAAATVVKLRLDGLVICGGDDSNTNAAVLAESFVASGVGCGVVGVPKTIDADLRTDGELEMSFGFDTASKVYANLLANISFDARANGNRWHFARVMGRSASHLALEVALQAHPNITVISEEVAARGTSLVDIVQDVKNLVLARHEAGKDYGVVLVPEGLIEVVRDLKHLVAELNELMAKGHLGDRGSSVSDQDVARLQTLLSPAGREVFAILPDWLRTQLLGERDPHGNVRVSLIESERLLASLVAQELARSAVAHPTLDFNYWCHFLGYQGRCSLPSNFDSDYCYVLGHLAGALVAGGATGVICAVRNLHLPVATWDLLGVPLLDLMSVERRKGKDKPVIAKKLVELHSRVFGTFAVRREAWRHGDGYPARAVWARYSGAVDDTTSATLALEADGRRAAALRARAKL